MTIEDLKKCKTDEQGRPLVKKTMRNDAGSVVATYRRWVWVDWPERSAAGLCPMTDDIDALDPVLPSPHAELVKELTGLAHALDECDFKYRAAVLRRAIAALEADTAEGGK